MSLPYIYIPNLLTPKESGCGCWPMGFCVSPCANMGLHMREGVRVHDIRCGAKYHIMKIGSSTVRLNCIYVFNTTSHGTALEKSRSNTNLKYCTLSKKCQKK